MGKSAWTDSDIARLRRHIDAGGSAIRAAAKFGRKIVAVQLMARKMGLRFPARKRFARPRKLKLRGVISTLENRTSMGRVPQIEIVRRAYKIWQDSGKPDGKDDEFYHRAERELEDELDRDAAAENKLDDKIPPAGPHAKPELTDPSKTPSSGTLPEPDQREVEGPSG